MIGIFDSGLGGLSVLEQSLRYDNQNNINRKYLYYADKINVPYGNKSKEQIISYSTKAVEFLLSLGAKAVVIACNTATSAAIQNLRDKFKNIPIIGMEPAIKLALNNTEKKILLLATPVTLCGEKLDLLLKSLDKKNQIIKLATPKLVDFAENFDFQSKNVTQYLKEELNTISNKSQIDSIVLGCTHFNYFKKTIKSLFEQNVNFFDGNEGTIKRLNDQIRLNCEQYTTAPDIRFFYSDHEVKDTNELQKIKMLLKILKEVSII